MNEIRIDICIATFRRPELLKKLLDSIFIQQIDSRIDFRIIVVDNDNSASAKPVIENLKRFSSKEIIYDIEPEQNIALVRNKAVSLATGDYIAFIDDDETAANNWLQNIVNCAIKYDADVVFGPVLPLYPKNTPKWIKNGKFFDKKNNKFGEIKKHGATNNTLVKTKIFEEHKFKFDKNYGLTGGEDTDLFHRISRSGFRMIWCDDAFVLEEIIPTKLKASWLVKRSFRSGQTYSRIFFPDLSSSQKIIWFVRRIFYIATCFLFFPFSLLGGRQYLLKCLRKIASNLGQLLGLFKWQYQEYKA